MQRRKKGVRYGSRHRPPYWNGACRSRHHWCFPVLQKGRQLEENATRYAHIVLGFFFISAKKIVFKKVRHKLKVLMYL